MKDARLFDAMSRIDDKYIDRSLNGISSGAYGDGNSQSPKRAVTLRRVLIIAAVLILAVTIPVSVYIVGGRNRENKLDPDITDSGIINTDMTSVPPVEPDKLAGLDFGGAEVNFYVGGYGADNYHVRSISVEDGGSDPLDRAIIERNARVEKKLGVKINVRSADHSIKQTLYTRLLAGDTENDIYGLVQYDDIGLCREGFFIDLDALADRGAPYIDTYVGSGWDNDCIKTLTSGGLTYYLAGDLSLRYTGGAGVIFVNDALYKDTLEDEIGSIYDLVRRGEWTYDKMLSILPLCFEDSNGNNRADINSDRLSLLLSSTDDISAMAIPAGVNFTSYDGETGYAQSAFNTGNRALIDFLTNMELLQNTSGVYKSGADIKGKMNAFAEGKAVFAEGWMYYADTYLRNMKDTFSIIPCPKLSKDSEYRSALCGEVNIYAINAHISDQRLQAAAATLQALAEESYKSVRFEYFDSITGGRYQTDGNMREMINIIYSGIHTDEMWVWQYDDSLADERMNRFSTVLLNAITNKNGINQITRNEDRLKSAFEKLMNDIRG